ncbi:MAG: hypothetical protein JO222_09570 [Frankiales bacterium]|nr:hypothetical protein [Frankiales bacterium]
MPAPRRTSVPDQPRRTPVTDQPRRTPDHAARRREHLAVAARSLARHTGAVVLSHESAALGQGLPTYAVPDRVRLTRPEGARRNDHRTRVAVAGLDPAEIVVRGGLVMTSVARTVLDIARERPLPEALITADAALRAGLPREALKEALAQQSGWPGGRAAMVVVRYADGRSESPAESFTRGRIIQIGLPVPELQVWLPTSEGDKRADFYWEQFRLAGEVDGRGKYQTVDDLYDEHQRQTAVSERHEVIRWTWRQAHAPDELFRERFMDAAERGVRRIDLLRSAKRP